jgi:hypothetical protein
MGTRGILLDQDSAHPARRSPLTEYKEPIDPSLFGLTHRRSMPA